MNSVYLQNKIITFSILGVLFALPLLLLNNVHHQFIYYLLLYMVTGYGHFILGFYYQIKSLNRKNDKTKLHGLMFYTAALIATLGFFLVTQTAWAFFVIAFVNAYFLLHGAFNEATLYKRQTTNTLPRTVYFIPVALFLLYVNSMSHFSAFFSYGFEFKFSSQQEMIAALPNVVHNLEIIFVWASGITMVIALGFLVDAIRRKNLMDLLILALTSLATVIALQLMNPIPFVILLSAVLVYHFVTWAVFYFQEFSYNPAQKELKAYTVLTILVHSVFLVIAVAGLMSTGIVKDIFNIVFLIPLFLSVTFMHITTSFLNEPWYKKITNIS